eukprot:m.336154 g.336154  ORF g.336154 m.336154 type:complete len:385 (-) comp17772_c0_seq1:77-1231(-)
MLKNICKFTLTRILPLALLVLAIFIGWLGTHESPEGAFFAFIIPVLHGALPPVMFGPYKTPLTPPVPDDLKPAPRPANELFRTLPSGAKMPQSGLGMCCRTSAYDHETAKRTVLWYLLQGGRLIDGAHMYLNHAAIGEGIKEAIARGIPRSEIFVTTKIQPRQYGREPAEKAVSVLLEELGLDYIDLILMHMPKAFPFMTTPCTKQSLNFSTCREETWKGLSAAQEKGLVKDIGISNFNINQTKGLQALKLAPIAVNQFQYNPWVPAWKHELFKYCQEQGIAVTAWSSLQGSAFQQKAALSVNTLKELAAKKGVSSAQVLLRWAIQKNAIVIPGTGTPKHMKENLNVYSFEFTPEEMATIDALQEDESATQMFMQPDMGDDAPF